MSKALTTSLVLFITLVISCTNTFAQLKWELGARVGDKSGFDATFPLANAPRLHGSVYLFEKYVGAGTYFDWLFQLADGPEGLKFYPGVGPEIYLGPEVEIAIAGNFGVEYLFDFPLTVGIDWRPSFMITDNLKYRGVNIGISARFRFGEGIKFVKTE